MSTDTRSESTAATHSTDTLESSEGFRLSPQQRRLIALNQADGEGIYQGGIVLEVEADLEPDVLVSACAAVVREHEILRTVYRDAPEVGAALQFVLPAGPSMLPFERLQGREAVERFFEQPFDVVTGPVCRFGLLQEKTPPTLLAISCAALACDRESLVKVARWVLEAYQSMVGDGAQPGEAVQYADVAEWLAELPRNEEADAPRRYWREQLPADLPAQRLLGERDRTPRWRHETRTFGFSLPPAVAEHLRNGDREDNRAWLLACWRVLVSTQANVDAMSIAVELFGRNLDELGEAIGPFAHSLPDTLDLSAFARFSDLRAAERARHVEAVRWQHYAQEWLPDPKDVDSPPGFAPCAFEATNTPHSLRAGPLSAEITRLRTTSERVSLGLWCDLSSLGPATLVYDAAMFAEDTVRSIAERFGILAEAALASPEASPFTLPSLPGDQTEALLARGIGPELAVADDATTTVLDWIADRSRRTPDAPAIVSDDTALRYGELWERSERVARSLHARGIGPEQPVALRMHSPLNMLVAMLGTLRAGAAYVPVDPAYPPDRQQLILEDCHASTVLIDGDVEDAGTPEWAQVQSLARVLEEAVANDFDPDALAVDPSSLAYIIYTSGSTGRPKGVQISHANLRASTQARLATYPDPVGKYLLLSPFAFDSSVAGIFWTLATGGTLVVPTDSRRNTEGLAEIISAQGITHVLAVPGMYRLLIEQADREALASLRVAIVAGEACPPGLLESHRQKLPACALYNEYGPSEATVWCSVERCDDRSASSTVPIGRPIPGVSLYLLDDHWRLAQPGAIGELYVGGPGICRGYMNQPGSTAARFVPNWFAATPGERLYATGDYARWLEDGSLQFLGRRDNQVKINGFRIELSEIEAALESHPGVREAAAVVRDDHTGARRIAGYAALNDGVGLDGEGIRRSLASRLPPWMVPSTVTLVSSFPRTPNGKLDRQALPEPGRAAVNRRAPSTPVEAQLAQVWRNLLNVDEVGVDDTFVSLGGDSLLALQMIAAARKVGIQITARLLFEYPTIAELATHAGICDAVTSIEMDGSSAAVSTRSGLTPAQRWFFERHLTRPDHYNQAVLVAVGRPLASDLLEAAIRAVYARHESLRHRFFDSDTGWRATVSDASVVSQEHDLLAIYDVRPLPEASRQAFLDRALDGLNARMDIQRGPLFRVAYIRRAPEQAGLLYWSVHHLVVDAVSWWILLEELVAEYRARESSRTPATPVASSSLSAWADHLGSLANTSAVEADRAWWEAQIGNPAGTLPIETQAEPNLERDVALCTEWLDQSSTDNLLRDAPLALGGDLHDVLVSTLALVVARWSGSARVRIDCERHGRSSQHVNLDASRTTGWLTSIYPAVLDFTPTPEADDVTAIRNAVAQCAAIPDQGFTYSLLRYLSQEPLVDPAPGEILFNYLGWTDTGITGDDLLQLVSTSVGQTRHPENQRAYLVEIDAEVVDGRLRFEWRYAGGYFTPGTIERQARSLTEVLQHIGRA